MSYFRNRGLAAVMEEAQVEAPVEPTTEVPAETEAAVGEMNSAGAEQEDFLTAMEEMVNDIDSLERTQDVIAESAEGDGAGMDETAAKIADVAIESIVNRMGFRQRKCIVSTEAFGSTNSRKYATKSAVESIGETLANAWKVFKEAVQKYWNKAVELFKKYFDANIKVRDAAKAMTKSIDAIKNQKPTVTTVDNSAVFNAFAVGNTVTAKSVTDILSSHEIVVGLAIDFVKSGTGIVEEAKKHIDAIKAAEGDAATVAKGAAAGWVTAFLKTASDHVSGVFKTFKDFHSGGTGSPGTESGMTSVGSEQLVNNQRMVVAFSESTDENTGSVFKCEIVPFAKEASGKGNVPVLGVGEMTSVCKAVESLANATEQLKTLQSGLGNFEKSVTSTIDAVIAKSGAEDKFDEETKNGLKKLKRAISDLNNALGRYTDMAPKLSVNASKAALNYVQVSMKSHAAPK